MDYPRPRPPQRSVETALLARLPNHWFQWQLLLHTLQSSQPLEVGS
jgi:hypothetical protein